MSSKVGGPAGTMMPSSLRGGGEDGPSLRRRKWRVCLWAALAVGVLASERVWAAGPPNTKRMTAGRGKSVPLDWRGMLVRLTHADASVRQTAAHQLGYVQVTDVSPGLRQAARDTVPGVRAAALGALGARNEVDAIPLITGALTDASATVRVAASQALARVDHPSAIPPLLTALNDAEAEVRAAAAVGLAPATPLDGDHGIIWVRLVNAFPGLTEEGRSSVVSVVGRTGEPRAEAWLIQLLEQDPAPAVRRVAALALTGYPSGDAALALGKALQGDPDPPVRSAAVQALTGFGVKAAPALPVLLEVLQRPTTTQHGQLLYVVGQIRDPFAVPVLGGLLKHRSVFARVEALSALFQITGTAATEAIVQGVTDADPSVAKQAVWFLGHRGTAGVPGLLAGLRHPQETVRAAAVLALAEQPEDRAAARNAILALRQDASRAVRTAVDASLARLEKLPPPEQDPDRLPEDPASPFNERP